MCLLYLPHFPLFSDLAIQNFIVRTVLLVVTLILVFFCFVELYYLWFFSSQTKGQIHLCNGGFLVPSESALECPFWPLAAALEGVGLLRRSLAFRSLIQKPCALRLPLDSLLHLTLWIPMTSPFCRVFLVGYSPPWRLL